MKVPQPGLICYTHFQEKNLCFLFFHRICETSRNGYPGARPSPLCIEVFLHDWTERIDDNVIEYVVDAMNQSLILVDLSCPIREIVPFP